MALLPSSGLGVAATPATGASGALNVIAETARTQSSSSASSSSSVIRRGEGLERWGRMSKCVRPRLGFHGSDRLGSAASKFCPDRREVPRRSCSTCPPQPGAPLTRYLALVTAHLFTSFKQPNGDSRRDVRPTGGTRDRRRPAANACARLSSKYRHPPPQR